MNIDQSCTSSFHLTLSLWEFIQKPMINMKFIVTGCTGFIGSEVLSQCLRNPTITSVLAVSRRKLPDSVSNDPKLNVVIMKDFNSYPDSVLKELSGADACIWYLLLLLLISEKSEKRSR